MYEGHLLHRMYLILLPHPHLLYPHGKEPRLGVAMTPVSGLLHVILCVCVCVCACAHTHVLSRWRGQCGGRLDPGSGTPEDFLGGLREVSESISLRFPICTLD